VLGTRTDTEPQILDAISPKLFVADVSCGLGHALFLVDGGRVFSWGNGGNGRLGLGDTADRAEATLISTFNAATVSSLSSGDPHMDVIVTIAAVQCGACHR